MHEEFCNQQWQVLLNLHRQLRPTHLTHTHLTFFPGKELARFSHELLQYYLQSGPICAHGNRVTLFNADRSAVMTFEIDYEKEKN